MLEAILVGLMLSHHAPQPKPTPLPTPPAPAPAPQPKPILPPVERRSPYDPRF